MSTAYGNLDVTQPHLMWKKVTSRNGRHARISEWHIDTSKPRMWVEGHEYRFNFKLVRVVDIKLER